MSNEDTALAYAKKVQECAKRLFNTPDGVEFLAALKTEYVDCTAMARLQDHTISNELTFYKLGQKELVQTLIQFLNDPEELNDVKIQNELSN